MNLLWRAEKYKQLTNVSLQVMSDFPDSVQCVKISNYSSFDSRSLPTVIPSIELVDETPIRPPEGHKLSYMSIYIYYYYRTWFIIIYSNGNYKAYWCDIFSYRLNGDNIANKILNFWTLTPESRIMKKFDPSVKEIKPRCQKNDNLVNKRGNKMLLLMLIH